MIKPRIWKNSSPIPSTIVPLSGWLISNVIDTNDNMKYRPIKRRSTSSTGNKLSSLFNDWVTCLYDVSMTSPIMRCSGRFPLPLPVHYALNTDSSLPPPPPKHLTERNSLPVNRICKRWIIYKGVAICLTCNVTQEELVYLSRMLYLSSSQSLLPPPF